MISRACGNPALVNKIKEFELLTKPNDGQGDVTDLFQKASI